MAIEDRPAMETPQHGPGREITDDLDVLLYALPLDIAESINRIDNRANLLEIVMDLGRLPSARFPGREVILSEREVTREDLDLVTSRIGEFGSDNRAGIERTLHRISAMRNRKGEIIGLTCRIGRAVYGTITIIRDLVETGRSILLLGRPGVGKTTLLREIARVLADEFNKRVVIVDTSNEIAGDGDIPHPAIGRARRMQVPLPEKQHAVMIEAVENHMPEAIVIDEIGTELEAAAARTIAERGVQLVGTAHGNTLENLMLNPTLSDLIGGIQTVTLGDDEARRRGTQKSILERKAPPTFEIIVEIQSWERVAVHESVADAVDALLRGHPAPPQVRQLDADGNVMQETLALPRPGETVGRGEGSRRERRHAATSGGTRPVGGFERHPTQDQSGLSTPLVNERPAGHAENIPATQQPLVINPIPPSALAPEPGVSTIMNNSDRLPFERSADEELTWFQDIPAEEAVERVRESGRVIPARNWAPAETIRPSRVYPYGISQTKLEEAAAEMQLPITVAKDVQDADLVMTLRNYYKRKPSPIREAESLGVPVYVLKSNTTLQMEQCLAHIYDLDLPLDPVSVAMQETEDAIDRMMSGQNNAVELSPQNAYIRRLQHQMAEKYNLTTRSRGREPHRRVRLLKEK